MTLGIYPGRIRIPHWPGRFICIGMCNCLNVLQMNIPCVMIWFVHDRTSHHPIWRPDRPNQVVRSRTNDSERMSFWMDMDQFMISELDVGSCTQHPGGFPGRKMHIWAEWNNPWWSVEPHITILRISWLWFAIANPMETILSERIHRLLLKIFWKIFIAVKSKFDIPAIVRDVCRPEKVIPDTER